MLTNLLDRRRLAILLLVALAVAGIVLGIATGALGGSNYSGPAQGATAIEYGLIAALIAVAAIA